MSNPYATITLSERDAQFAIEHLRFLADRERPTEADHAAACLSARFVADQIQAALTAENDRCTCGPNGTIEECVREIAAGGWCPRPPGSRPVRTPTGCVVPPATA